MQQLGDLVLAIRGRNTVALETIGRKFGGTLFVAALKKSIEEANKSKILIDVPPIDVYRVEELLTRSFASAYSCKSMIANIAAMRIQQTALQIQIDSDTVDSSLLDENSPDGFSYREVEKRKSNADDAYKHLDKAGELIRELSTDLQNEIGRWYSDAKIPEYIQAARAMAQISNDNPLNPSRYIAAETLQSRDLGLASDGLNWQKKDQGVRLNLVQAETWTQRATRDANDYVLQAYKIKQKQLERKRQLLVDLKSALSLEEELSQLTKRYAVETEQLDRLLAALAEGLSLVYGSRLPTLCKAWEDYVTSSKSYSTGNIERALSLLTDTEIALRDTSNSSSASGWTTNVTLTRAEGDFLKGSLNLADVGLPSDAHCRGITLALLGSANSTLWAKITVNDSISFNAPLVMSISDSGKPMLYGSQQLWNRPPPVKIEFLGRFVGIDMPDSIKLLMCVHFVEQAG